MKRIYYLMLKSYLGPLVMTFFIALFILLMQFLWKYIDELVGKGLEWYILAELLFYASSTFVPLALPLAILLASLMTFGNLGEYYELVAMKSAGISLRKIMLPLVVVTAVISISALLFSNFILPRANLKFHSTLYDVRKQRLALNIKPGMFYKGLDGYVIRAENKLEDGKTLENILIYDHTKRMGNISVTQAEKGKMEITQDQKYLLFTLNNGYNFEEILDKRDHRIKKPLQRTRFKEEIIRFDMSGFQMNRTDEELFRNNYQMFNLRQIAISKDSLKGVLHQKKENMYSTLVKHYNHLVLRDSTPADSIVNAAVDMEWDSVYSQVAVNKTRIHETAINSARAIRERIRTYSTDFSYREKKILRHEIEWHRKFTLSFGCLVLFFIGAPLGAIIRKGGLGLPVVFSIIFFVFFHVISITAEKFVKEGVMPSWQGMWLATVILLPIGAFLTIKATTDAPLLDAEAWRKYASFFTVFIKKLRRK